MSEERRKILEMLADGKISAGEAEKLLDAVSSAGDGTGLRNNEGKVPKYLYVRIEPKDGSKESDQVKITVPLALIKAGINLFSLLPKDARKDVEQAMSSKGLNFDFNSLSGEDLDELLEALKELEVNVETSENTVKIFAG